jgi:hypothetical protein
MKQRLIYNLIILFGLLLFSASSKAQFSKDEFVTKDPRVNILIQKQIELNRNEFNRRTYVMQGYRIQVISSNNRNQVMSIKSDLLKNYPNEQTYLIYQSPNFRLLFGNYTTYKAAQTARTELERVIGNSLLIVPSKVEVKGVNLVEEKKQL